MMETQVDLLKTDHEISRQLKNQMNHSLFIRRDASVAEQERSLDTIFGDFKSWRLNVASTLKKHVVDAGQKFPEHLSDPSELALSKKK